MLHVAMLRNFDRPDASKSYAPTMTPGSSRSCWPCPASSVSIPFSLGMRLYCVSYVLFIIFHCSFSFGSWPSWWRQLFLTTGCSFRLSLSSQYSLPLDGTISRPPGRLRGWRQSVSLTRPIPNPSPPPLFGCLQYANMEEEGLVHSTYHKNDVNVYLYM